MGDVKQNNALDWWRSVENSSVVDLQKASVARSVITPMPRAPSSRYRRPLRLQSDFLGTLGTRRVLVGQGTGSPRDGDAAYGAQLPFEANRIPLVIALRL